MIPSESPASPAHRRREAPALGGEFCHSIIDDRSRLAYIQHRRIPPRTPQHNGKVERYHQTLSREWAYRQRYRNSDARAGALPIWLKHYNFTRSRSSLSNRPPISWVRNDPRHNS